MRCRDALRLSTAYVDGELDERRSRAVRGHLRTCPACATAADDEARLRRAAAELEPLEPPSSMWQQIQSHLAVDEIAEAGRSPIGLGLLCALNRLRRHALSAAVVVTAAILALVWLGGPTSSSPLLYQILPAPRAAAPIAPASLASVEQALAGELVTAVAHHEEVIAELSLAMAELRPTWSERERRRFDRELADARGRIARLRAGVHGAGEGDALLGAYRTEIALLTRAASGGAGALALVGPPGAE